MENKFGLIYSKLFLSTISPHSTINIKSRNDFLRKIYTISFIEFKKVI